MKTSFKNLRDTIADIMFINNKMYVRNEKKNPKFVGKQR